jgi:hypothetical protein
MKAERGDRGIVLPIHNLGARRRYTLCKRWVGLEVGLDR